MGYLAGLFSPLMALCVPVWHWGREKKGAFNFGVRKVGSVDEVNIDLIFFPTISEVNINLKD